MTAPGRRWLLIIIMTFTAITLAALFRPLWQTKGFHVPSVAEARVAQALFSDALQSGHLPPKDTKALGLFAKPVGEQLVLTEAKQNCQGRGGYVLRNSKDAVPVAITAPHRGSDRHSGTIAQLLYVEHPFAAVAWNSAPRHASERCPYGGDIAQTPTHYFTAFSLAFARHLPAGRVVQLHGFDQSRRKSRAAREADMIISDGSRKPAARLLNMANCMMQQFPHYKIAVYPIDTDELGATSNAQGQALRKQGFKGFTHVEMDAAVRVALVNDPAMRAQFAKCLSV
jgi:hypothetical protein